MTEQPDRPLSAQLEPPPGVAAELFQALLRKGHTQSLASGTVLFHAGDSDRSAYYLLSGEMRLTDERGTSEPLLAGTAAAKRPIAHRQPRIVTAIAAANCKVLRFDREVLRQAPRATRRAGSRSPRSVPMSASHGTKAPRTTG